MKRIVAALLSALLCVQPVHAMRVREPVLYTDTQEGSGTEEKEAGEQEGTGTEENAEEKTRAQEDMDTQGEAEAAGEEKPKEAAEGEDQADGTADEGVQNEAGMQSESAGAGQVEVSAPSAILMEVSTGQVIYDKDADTQRPPASVTKVMTLLLIFDALNDGKIRLEDEVTTSEYAASMGGSQVFLEPGEVQTADTLIKCISVASANDACAAFKNSTALINTTLY